MPSRPRFATSDKSTHHPRFIDAYCEVARAMDVVRFMIHQVRDAILAARTAFEGALKQEEERQAKAERDAAQAAPAVAAKVVRRRKGGAR
jgi:hypothetical protein